MKITIAKAMLSTCSTPPIFTTTHIAEDFANFDGDLSRSNPTREIIAEAHRVFGDDRAVACLLSIGCGHSGVKPSLSASGIATWIDFLNRVSMDSEKTAREMATWMQHLTLYHRLSVDYGLLVDQLSAWKDPVVIATHTAKCLDDLEAIERLNRCVDTISNGDGLTTLEQLSKCVINGH